MTFVRFNLFIYFTVFYRLQIFLLKRSFLDFIVFFRSPTCKNTLRKQILDTFLRLREFHQQYSYEVYSSIKEESVFLVTWKDKTG